MDTYVLKDKTEISVDEGGNIFCFTKAFPDLDEYISTLKKLTYENLSTYNIKNCNGVIINTFYDKKCVSSVVTHNWSDNGSLTSITAKFLISDLSEYELCLKSLNEIKQSKAAQDKTLADLRTLIASQD